MEFPLLNYQCLSVDQFQSSCCCSSSNGFCRFPVGFSNQIGLKTQSLLSGCLFKLNKMKWVNPFGKIKCYAVDKGFKPKPKRNYRPLSSDVDLREGGELERKESKRHSVLSSQIEKLVLFRRYKEALELFEVFELTGRIELGDSTYDALMSACIGLRSIPGVKRVYNYMLNSGLEPDLYMRNRVLLMHVKCGMMVDAQRLFEEMQEKNPVTWNIMIGGLVDKGDFVEAFRLFMIVWELESADCGSRTFASMVHATAGLGLISTGKQLHACTLKMGIWDDMFVSCALIDMYSKCGSIEDAHCVFYDMPEKTTVGWNTIIAGYALNGYSEEALDMYYEMREAGVKADHFTFSIIVRICARLASMEHAKQAHAALIRNGFGSDMVANSTLVDFYCKWGRVEDARRVFDKMSCKNVISWNALIAGYGNHGRGAEAIELFERMLQEKMRPNHVTFLAVLSACSYSGLSEPGLEIFQSMSRDHKIKPRAMHYACMIELLGKEGLLDEAFAVIRNVPFEPTVNMWAALLTACRYNENLELGKFAAEKLYGMEPEKLGNYVVLLNIYNSAGKLEEAAGVVHTLKRKGLRMLPACSWIEVKRKPYTFLSGDKSHPQREEIFRKVDDLMLEISKHGYVQQEKTLLPDVNEQEERVLKYHSEKLAIAFGLINSPSWTPLLVVQGHRICNDCHEAIKLISLVTRRKIVVRDASRFHYFRDGRCSCGDYW